MTCVRGAIALLALAFALAAPATAQQSTIYKWRDANGVVHYSNSPPPEGTQSSVLDETKSKVSVVPAYQAPPEASASGSDKQLQNRVQRLERELEDERRSQTAASQAQTDAYQRWREDCLKQRRLDCDDPAAVPTPIYGYPAPPVVRPPVARPPVQPAPPRPARPPEASAPPVLEEPRPGAKVGQDVIRPR